MLYYDERNKETALTPFNSAHPVGYVTGIGLGLYAVWAHRLRLNLTTMPCVVTLRPMQATRISCGSCVAIFTKMFLFKFYNTRNSALFSTSRHAHRLYLSYNNYIGCQLKLEYHTNCVLTELRHYLVELCQPCSDTRLYVLCHAATIMSPVLTDVLLIVPFLSLPPLFGTVCLAMSVAHLLSHLS